MLYYNLASRLTFFWENQLINSYTVVHANITPTYFTCDSLDFLKAPVSGFCWFPVSAGQVPHSLSLRKRPIASRNRLVASQVGSRASLVIGTSDSLLIWDFC